MTQRMEMKRMTHDGETPQYRYILLQDVDTKNGGRRITYGIAVYTLRHMTGDSRIVAWIRDITPNRTAIETLIRQCNEGALSPIHLADVVDDFLGA